MPTAEDILIGKIAISLGFIDPEQLTVCLRLQEEQLASQGRSLSIVDWLLKRGYIDQGQLSIIHKRIREQKTQILEPTGEDKVEQDTQETKKPSYQQETVNALESKSPFLNLINQITPQMSFGKYQILEEIGRGGMGKVYSAFDPGMDRVVAIKLLISDGEMDTQRFLREANTMAQLDHPHIVRVYELGEYEKVPFFTMELIEGESLHQFLKKSALSTRQSAELMKKIGGAVAYAHKKGIVHRDLKPANVMLTPAKEPKLMDFGLAKLIGGSTFLSQTGIIMGTLQYMPPEQAEGKVRNIDERSDVYGLGAILYELLTGTPPFTGSSFSQVLDKVLHRPPIQPTQIKPRIPRPLENICLKCLEKEKENRYQTVDAFVQDISLFLRGRKIQTSSLGTWKVKKGLFLAGGLLFILLLVGLLFQGLKFSQLERKIQEAMASGDKCMKEKEFGPAVEWYQKAFFLSDKDPIALQKMEKAKESLIDHYFAEGNRCLLQNNKKEAREWYQKILSIDSRHTKALAQLHAIEEEEKNSPEGIWKGEWRDLKKGSRFFCNLKLSYTKPNKFKGAIEWTLKESLLPSVQTRIGMNAIEYVTGEYIPSNRLLCLAGYEKEDPHQLISLDQYVMVLSGDGKFLQGKSHAQGSWMGQIKFARGQK